MKLIRLRDDQICSNGKAIVKSEDGGLSLLDIDSPTRQVVRYPIDIPAGRLGDAQVVIDFAGDPAVPDGAIVTPDQTGIIVAMFRPEVAEYGETRLYDLSTGELKCTWQTLGSPQNTCPAIVRHETSLTPASHWQADFQREASCWRPDVGNSLGSPLTAESAKCLRANSSGSWPLNPRDHLSLGIWVFGGLSIAIIIRFVNREKNLAPTVIELVSNEPRTLA